MDGLGNLLQSSIIEMSDALGWATEEDFLENIKKSPLFKGFSESEQKSANQTLIAIANDPMTEERIDDLSRLLSFPSPSLYSDSLFLDENIHHLLTIAHLRGKISEQQIGTAFLFLSAKKRYESSSIQKNIGYESKLREIPLFHLDGSINEEARAIITQTIKDAPLYSPTQAIDGQEKPIISSDQLDQWFEEMKGLDESEKRFFIAKRANDALKREGGYHDRLEKTSELVDKLLIQNAAELLEDSGLYELGDLLHRSPNSEKPTITDAVVTTGYNLFNYYQDPVTKMDMRMVPSIGMISSLIEVSAGDNGLKAGIRFKARNPIQSNRNSAIEGIREIVVRNPYSKTPVTADFGLYAPHLEFTIHDLYHIFVASQIPNEFRLLNMAFADVFSRYPETANLADTLYDNEAASFRSDIEQNRQLIPDGLPKKQVIQRLFWQHLIMNVIINYYFNQLLQALSENASKEIFLQIIEKLKNQVENGLSPELKSIIKTALIQAILKEDSMGKQMNIDIEILKEMNETAKEIMLQALLQALPPIQRIQYKEHIRSTIPDTLFKEIYELAVECQKELDQGLHTDLPAITQLKPIEQLPA